MFCHICGTQIPEDAGFCHKCGARVIGEVNSTGIELNTKNMQVIDLFITYKADRGFNSSVVGNQEWDVFVDNEKIGRVLYGETIAYKITLGQHCITLGVMRIWVDASEGKGSIRLTIQSIVGDDGALEYQLICEPSQLVILDPTDNPEIMGEGEHCINGDFQQLYHISEPNTVVCHRCGTELDKKTEFCHKCGAKIGYKENGPRLSELGTVEKYNKSRLECPNCHSTDLIPITETKTDVSGGGYGVGKGCCGWILLGPLGLLCGLCGTGVKSQSTTITSWVCRSCGHKFRTAEDIEREKAAETAVEMQRMLGGSLILYIAGNLLADQGWTFFGIPNWIFITVGSLGAIVAMVGFLFPISGRIEEIEEEQEKAKAVFGITSVVLAFCMISLIGGILFAIGDVRFFWIPAWVYILLGVIGTLISGIVMLMAWMLGLNEEEAAQYEEKAERFMEKHKAVFDFIGKKIFRN